MIRLILILVFVTGVLAEDNIACVYQNEKGAFTIAKGRQAIPAKFRKSAQCITAKESAPLASPQDITLSGNKRSIEMSSSLGRMQVRWLRSVEQLFGKTPERALASAAQAVSRALKASSFPTELRNLNLNWDIVFLDEELPETQIPAYLVNNCHPAWMIPPANIYVVAQRLLAGCGGEQATKNQVNDAKLAEVLIHEIGHAVEQQLINEPIGFDRIRAEGFATWFTWYASDYSSLINRSSIEKEYYNNAKSSFASSLNNFVFMGTAEDYARASLYFQVVYKKYKTSGIVSLYEMIKKNKLNLARAVKEKLGVNDQELQESLLKLLS